MLTETDSKKAAGTSSNTRGLRGFGGGQGLVSAASTRCFVYCRKSTEDDNRQTASIESQKGELQRAFGNTLGLEIIGVYEEARSAKTLGRPIFNEMLARIERGEANCIIAWAPDRLARNPMDGSRIVCLLDAGILRDLKFATYTFENNSQGKFMLSIMFGQSKYYSDALSDNVKRGNRTKAAKGWRPSSVPLGYRHDSATKTIAVDPTYMPLIRRMFDLMLTGGYSSRRIARIARDDWGLRTPAHWKRGGQALPPASVHRMLTNPFYAGIFTHDGQVLEGKHEPAISMERFQAVQAAVRRPISTRAKSYSFPFTGLIRCGSCGRAVTAENKTNRYGSHYIYSHCSRTGPGKRCTEPSVRAEALQAQIVTWLRSFTMRPEVEKRLREILERSAGSGADQSSAIRQSVEHALRAVQGQITELTGLRLRNLVSDDEFTTRRAALQAEAVGLARRLEQLGRADDDNVFELFSSAISFSTYAADWFEKGDDHLKRLIVKTACSNSTLTNKILSIEAAKWMSAVVNLARCHRGRGDREDVRTFLLENDEQRFLMRTVIREMASTAQLKSPKSPTSLKSSLPQRKRRLQGARAKRVAGSAVERPAAAQPREAADP